MIVWSADLDRRRAAIRASSARVGLAVVSVIVLLVAEVVAIVSGQWVLIAGIGLAYFALGYVMTSVWVGKDEGQRPSPGR